MYPTQVPINQENLKKLTSTLEAAYSAIIDEMTSATKFGVANRKAILAQIKQILKETAVDLQLIIEDDLTKEYMDGADEAIKQLKNTGADISVKEGFNRVHREAIIALVDDTSRAFAESITGVGRSANLILGRATRDLITQKIAQGVIGGKALREVKKTIIGTIKSEGLSALVDKAGHTWTLDRYSEMLYRTKVVEARNRGLANRMVENDYDLVQVSSHGATDVCGRWEGAILSLSGQTEGYKTIAQAEQDGLFHPNCRHAINALVPSLARRTRAYDATQKTLGPVGASVNL